MEKRLDKETRRAMFLVWWMIFSISGVMVSLDDIFLKAWFMGSVIIVHHMLEVISNER